MSRDILREMRRMSGEPDSPQDMGKDLVEFSEQGVVAKRGKLDDLFPYILLASKTMSARAISRWFQDHKNYQISAASVSTALREKDTYLKEIFARARFGAAQLAEVTDYTPEKILLDSETVFGAVTSDYTHEWGNKTAEEKKQADDVIFKLHLLDEWRGLPDEVRTICIEKFINNKKKGADTK
ncbi:MAG: hypothetical protein WC959_09740 [Kiritimatiellales bacterium]